MRYVRFICTVIALFCSSVPAYSEPITVFFGITEDMPIQEARRILAQEGYEESSRNQYNGKIYLSSRYYRYMAKEFTFVELFACAVEGTSQEQLVELFFEQGNDGRDGLLSSLEKIGIGLDHADIDGNIVMDTETTKVFLPQGVKNIVVTFKHAEKLCQEANKVAVAKQKAKDAQFEQNLQDQQLRRALEQVTPRN